MRSDHGAGALAIEVEVADVEAAFGVGDLAFVAGVHGARESVFGVVGDGECIVPVAGFDHREHRAEDFLLRDLRLRGDVGHHRGLDEIAWSRCGAPTGHHTTLALAGFDVLEDLGARLLVHHRSHVVGAIGRRTDGEAPGALGDLVHHGVVDRGIDDGAGARRTLLPLESERRSDDAVGRFVEVGVGSDHDRILAPHLGDDALDPDLSGLGAGGAFIDAEADFLRTGEGHEAGLRMLDQTVADACPGAGDEVQDSGWDSDFAQERHDLGRDAGRIARRLEHHRVAGHDRGGRHPHQNRIGKIPRRDDDPDAERHVHHLVVLVRHRRDRLLGGVTQHLAPVELHEIDRFRGIDIRLHPTLPDFVDHIGGKEVPALAHPRRGLEEQFGPVRRTGVLPGFEGARRRSHRRIGMRDGRGREVSQHLFRIRGIPAREGVVGGDFLPVDPHRVAAPEGGAHFGQRLFERGLRFRSVEIGEGLVAELGRHGAFLRWARAFGTAASRVRADSSGLGVQRQADVGQGGILTSPARSAGSAGCRRRRVGRNRPRMRRRDRGRRGHPSSGDAFQARTGRP